MGMTGLPGHGALMVDRRCLRALVLYAEKSPLKLVLHLPDLKLLRTAAGNGLQEFVSIFPTWLPFGSTTVFLSVIWVRLA